MQVWVFVTKFLLLVPIIFMADRAGLATTSALVIKFVSVMIQANVRPYANNVCNRCDFLSSLVHFLTLMLGILYTYNEGEISAQAERTLTLAGIIIVVPTSVLQVGVGAWLLFQAVASDEGEVPRCLDCRRWRIARLVFGGDATEANDSIEEDDVDKQATS